MPKFYFDVLPIQYLYSMLHMSFQRKGLNLLAPRDNTESWWISVEEDGHLTLIEWNDQTPRAFYITYVNANLEVTVQDVGAAINAAVSFTDEGKAS